MPKKVLAAFEFPSGMKEHTKLLTMKEGTITTSNSLAMTATQQRSQSMQSHSSLVMSEEHSYGTSEELIKHSLTSEKNMSTMQAESHSRLFGTALEAYCSR